jgi:hypothetical protein
VPALIRSPRTAQENCAGCCQKALAQEWLVDSIQAIDLINCFYYMTLLRKAEERTVDGLWQRIGSKTQDMLLSKSEML